MSTYDDMSVLESIDRPVRPRPEFAVALRGRLEAELATAVTQPPEPAASPRRWRLRVALAVAVLVILCVGVAVAARATHVWVLDGRGGTQLHRGVASSSTLPAPPGPELAWARFALAPGGHDLYTIGWPANVTGGQQGVAKKAAVVVFHGVDTPRPVRSSTDVELPGAPGFDPWISVGPTGRVFMGLARSVVLVDGHRARTVVTLRQLGVTAKALDPFQSFAVAATTANRLVIRAQTNAGRSWKNYGDYRFFEVIDRSGDGSWSDVSVRPIRLPASVPVLRGGLQNRWESVQLLPLADAPGGAGSSAVIATMLNLDGRFRAYVLDDRNADGDFTDPGETRLLVNTTAEAAGGMWGPILAVRNVSGGDKRISLVATGMTRASRVSVISPSGAIHDIARSFPSSQELSGVMAGPQGRVYAVIHALSPGEHWLIDRYRITTADFGSADTGKIGATWHAPESSPGHTLVFPSVRGTWTISATGGAAHLLTGKHASPECLSVDGRRLFYSANVEAPNEWFLYTARAGVTPIKVTERPVEPVCPGTDSGIVLDALPGEGELHTLIWHDLRTGRERTLATHVERFTLSTDGTRLAYVKGREHLVVVDLGTGHAKLLASVSPHTSFGVPDRSGYDEPPGRDIGLRWSADGSQVAYVTGPSIHERRFIPAKVHDSDFTVGPQHYTLWVRDAHTGAVVLRRSIVSGPPTLSWSPAGSRLLVCTNVTTLVRSCPGQIIESDKYNSPLTGSVVPHSPATLSVIDPATGATTRVARGAIAYAQWAPDGTTLAYATPTTLYTVDLVGHPRLVARAPQQRWATSIGPAPLGRLAIWLGYSPDGTLIAYMHGRQLDTVNMTTGAITRVVAPNHLPVVEAWWWAPGMDQSSGIRLAWG